MAWVAEGARADKPAGLSPQTLVSPSGPASLKGLGDSFSANASTGTGGFSIPAVWPVGLPSGLSIYMQCWVLNGPGTAVDGASNALRAVAQ